MQRSATRICGAMSARPAESAFERGSVIGFKGGPRGFEQLASRHDHDVEAFRKFCVPENLSYQSFSAISLDGATQLFRRRDPQPADCLVIGQDEQRAVAAANSGAVLVDLLEFSATADPLAAAKAPIDFQLWAHGRQSRGSCQVRNAIRC